MDIACDVNTLFHEEQGKGFRVQGSGKMQGNKGFPLEEYGMSDDRHCLVHLHRPSLRIS